MAGLVSILIPAYNAEKWIADTVKSALTQTWPKKEIIIVDDGSSDDTFQIARGFESSSVKAITKENRGASAARNKALELAQGDYIQWLDADDLLAPDKISQQFKEVGGCPNPMILYSAPCGTFYFDYRRAKFTPNPLCRDLTPVDWAISKFMNNAWMSIAGWLVSRKLADLSGPWDERLSVNDDGEYISRVVARSQEVRFVPEAKCYYRIGNANSLNSQSSNKALESLFLSLSLSINHLRSMEDSERTKRAGLVYLQTWFPVFYPEKYDLIRKINCLAEELGGGLMPPALGLKYSLAEKIFGYKAAKNFMLKARGAKLAAVRNWEKFSFL